MEFVRSFVKDKALKTTYFYLEKSLKLKAFEIIFEKKKRMTKYVSTSFSSILNHKNTFQKSRQNNRF